MFAFARPAIAEPPQPLGPDEIHVWICEFPVSDPATCRSAAQRFLRRVLAAYRGCDEGELVLETGAHGKPALADASVAFNLSHSGTHAALVLASGVEVGIDLESPSRPRPHMALARRYFCEREAAALAAITDSERENAFLRLWTAKEAVLKALGRGLAFGLDRLEFDLATEPPRLRWIAADGGMPADWQVHALPLVQPVVGHLAWRGEPRQRLFLRCADPGINAAGLIPTPVVGQGLTG
ncbi:MAG: 4'-phosphopantetheinyl transferase superfamily protein [Rhodanobacteraceae bacterium]|nr:4'-phosphopantetheinyl transferase superfamily protein [Rhodanobacteraceae bacterium]